ncbi:MAG: homocysteine biosynthesis protein [Candidatus Micrarchaeia archaeon]
MVKTIDEINRRIANGDAVVVTAEEMTEIVHDEGAERAAKEVDVVTTGTFGLMCSSGAFLNFGHADPPIKIGGGEITLNGVPAYAGLAAVDTYIGATQISRERERYGGGHVIEDLVAGKAVTMEASGYGTDCYPRKRIKTDITLEDINQAILLNPRNAYQRYMCAVNSSDRPIYTYMGALLPNFGNATYSGAGALSPLNNDPEYRTIGIGTRIFLGGGVGYVIGEGTQHNPKNALGTLMVRGDMKQMDARFVRGAYVNNYGASLYVGLGIPIPVIDEEMARRTGVSDAEIFTDIVDYSVQSRNRPSLGKVSYAQLKSGRIEVGGKRIKCYPLSSLHMAREVAEELKKMIEGGDFMLSQAVENLPREREFKPMKHPACLVGEFMREAVTCRENEDVRAVAKLLVEKGINHVVVVSEENKLIGIITSWDIASSLLLKKDRVGDVMTRKVITTRADEEIEIAVRRMEKNNISALPVIDKDGKVVGIITSEEIASLLGKNR